VLFKSGNQGSPWCQERQTADPEQRGKNMEGELGISKPKDVPCIQSLVEGKTQARGSTCFYEHEVKAGFEPPRGDALNGVS